jgi:hypothetical protein
MSGNNQMTKVWAERFTDEKLNGFIHDYKQRKKDEEESMDHLHSLF